MYRSVDLWRCVGMLWVEVPESGKDNRLPKVGGWLTADSPAPFPSIPSSPSAWNYPLSAASCSGHRWSCFPLGHLLSRSRVQFLPKWATLPLYSILLNKETAAKHQPSPDEPGPRNRLAVSRDPALEEPQACTLGELLLSRAPLLFLTLGYFAGPALYLYFCQCRKSGGNQPKGVGGSMDRHRIPEKTHVTHPPSRFRLWLLLVTLCLTEELAGAVSLFCRPPSLLLLWPPPHPSTQIQLSCLC